jgi:hypothetical protein
MEETTPKPVEKKVEEFSLNQMRPCIALRLRGHPLLRIDHGVNPETGKNVISYVFEATVKPDYELWIAGSNDGIFGPLREFWKMMDEWKEAVRSLPIKRKQ